MQRETKILELLRRLWSKKPQEQTRPAGWWQRSQTVPKVCPGRPCGENFWDGSFPVYY